MAEATVPQQPLTVDILHMIEHLDLIVSVLRPERNQALTSSSFGLFILGLLRIEVLALGRRWHGGYG
jgi:hypothetical protein